jgi:hypothetical protein
VPIALLAVFSGTIFFTMQIQVTTVLDVYYSIRSPSQLGIYTGLAGLSVIAGTCSIGSSRPPGRPHSAIAFGMLGVNYVMMNVRHVDFLRRLADRTNSAAACFRRWWYGPWAACRSRCAAVELACS